MIEHPPLPIEQYESDRIESLFFCKRCWDWLLFGSEQVYRMADYHYCVVEVFQLSTPLLWHSPLLTQMDFVVFA
jgi:hypothetical protein